MDQPLDICPAFDAWDLDGCGQHDVRDDRSRRPGRRGRTREDCCDRQQRRIVIVEHAVVMGSGRRNVMRGGMAMHHQVLVAVLVSLMDVLWRRDRKPDHSGREEKRQAARHSPVIVRNSPDGLN